jgi:hypothetical protein
MVGRKNSSRELGEHSIFGDEQAAQLRLELDELRSAVSDLSARLHAQFTTIAAHAEIAREQAEFARAEARADLDRTRGTLIELIEQVREQIVEPGHHVRGAAPGPSFAAQSERLAEMETRLDGVSTTVDTCFDRQRELADMVAAVLDTVLAEPQGHAVDGLALT